MTRTDAELVVLARQGERNAFDELICRYQKPAARLAWVLVGDPFEAKDVAQEAFLRAWQNLNVLNDPAKFVPWLRRIVFGIAIDWLRAFRPELYRLADESSELTLLSYPSPGSSALETMETADLRQRVWAAVARLPERYRVPLTMFHFDGISHARVAHALGLPESTVRSLVTRARAQLRPMLADYAEQWLPGLHDVLEEQKMDRTALLHFVDGDSVGGSLSQSGLPGEIVVYGDLLYEGPAPSAQSDDEWIATRRDFYAHAGHGPADGVEKFLRDGERALERLAQYEEAIFWFDHHLTDQLLLMKLLATLSRFRGDTRLTLVSIAEFPGVKPFIALGQLTADQLYSLGDTRSEITGEQLRMGKRAWQAFTSADPRAVERLLGEDTSVLPFFAAAFRRHLEEFPSLENGLSRTEQAALSVLHEKGALPAARLFHAVQLKEDLIFMGDSSFYRILKLLASGAQPVIDATAKPTMLEDWNTVMVSINDTGRKILEGAADRIDLCGIDEWRGGVHLRNGAPLWRWDRGSQKLVAS